MTIALSSFELHKRYWYFWNQETKMHQLRGGHMGLGSKAILGATLEHILGKEEEMVDNNGQEKKQRGPWAFGARKQLQKPRPWLGSNTTK